MYEVVQSGVSYSPSVIASFNSTNGAYPHGNLVVDAAGDLFGTTVLGGANNAGTVYEIAKTGNGTYSAPQTLYNFNQGEGSAYGGLVADTSGNLIGTTDSGGANGKGEVYEITDKGGVVARTVLASFDGTNGSDPQSKVFIDAQGNLFGTTTAGGAGSNGTVYEIPSNGSGGYGALKDVAFFSGDGSAPLFSSVIADPQGNLFGTTEYGGLYDHGTIFEIVKTGVDVQNQPVYSSAPQVLYSFGAGTYGSYPGAGLIIDAKGDLFGTTTEGGPPTPEGFQGAGTVFELAKTGLGYSGTPTLLAGLGESGSTPYGALYADAAGNLFGTTKEGGSSNNGTVFEITNSGFVACYCPGTLILTSRGEVPVEDLAIGDLLVTAAGAHRPLKWIGRRSYAGRFVNGNRMALPVRFAAGSLGTGVPRRDLWVSPGHAMLVEGQLIHAHLLVNGVSITQAEAVETVTYLNVEFDDHDIVLAEGAPAESFYDNGMRNAFANAAEFGRLYPDDPGPGLPVLPLLEQGDVLDGIRSRIDARAGIVAAPPAAPGPLSGYVDVAGPDIVTGWAQDDGQPEVPVRLDVLVDGRRVMRVLANRHRADLRDAGLGSGRHSFEVRLPDGCRGTVSVRRTADGAALPLTGRAAEALAAAA